MAKIINCPLCSSSEHQDFWALPGYQLYRCSACDFVWDPFPPENLLSQYGENYFINNNPKGGYANYFEGMKINRRTFYQRLARIRKRNGNQGAVLDIGCALGDCLLEAKKLGFNNLTGLDTSAYAVKQCQKRKLKAVNGTLGTAKIPPQSFDLVLSQDVLEHVSDPVSELKKIYKIMKPGALLFIVTPEMDGWWHRLLHSYWYHYKPGEHVSYFSQKTVKSALSQSGFTAIVTRPTYHVMSLEYIFCRLRYYSPFIFGTLFKIVTLFKIQHLAFRVYAGELEAWAYKPR